MGIGPADRRRIDRDDGRRSATAFVLSGGGNQGVAQVGMLRALVERAILPDVIVGTSAGAMNGAAIASSPDLAGVARLAEVWTALRAEQVFPGGRVGPAWNVLRRDTYLYPNDGLAQVIADASRSAEFSDLSIPLRVVATDLDTGEEVVLASGPLGPALLASAALPGVYPIVEHDGRRLVDGGVVNSVPLDHALAGPIERIYVLNVSGAAGDHNERSPLDVVMRAFLHARNRRFEHELRRVPEDVHVTVLPRPYDDRPLLDFSRAEQIIDEAYELTLHALDAERRTPRPGRGRTRRGLRLPARRVGKQPEAV